MIVFKNKVRIKKGDEAFIKEFGFINAAKIATSYKATHKTPFIYDANQLAIFLHIDVKKLFQILNNINKNYTFFTIKKANGKERKIYAPSPDLISIQKIILRKILYRYPVSKYATAYTKRSNLYSNAKPHSNKKHILKLDITDFFGSITFEQVMSTVFNKNYYPVNVGVALTNLCCYKGALVQGAPTSPMLSNLIMKHFDDVMGEWCSKQNIDYTRYCDDMTFSSDKPLYHVFEKAKSFLYDMGFDLNKRKIHFIKAGRRQEVTGLVVNKKVSVPKEYKRKLRQQIYYFLKYDANDKALENSGINYITYLNSLLGKTAYVLSVEPNNEYFKNKKSELLIRRYESEKSYDTY